MFRRSFWLSLCLLSLGCGRDIRPKQLDEPCTRTEQCVMGLTCLSGVCLAAPEPDLDAGVDAGSAAGS